MGSMGSDPSIARHCSWHTSFKRVTRNCGKKRLTGAVFLDMAKAFDTLWIDGLLYNLTFLSLPPYLLKPSHPTSGAESSKFPS
jgi:hypothetical protein